MASSSVARLVDMIEAIELIRAELAGATIQAFQTDRRKHGWSECGLEIISEASRRLPSAMKARHPIIPWSKVAGIGNILRHDYEHGAYDVLRRVAHDDLPTLERVCREELAGEQGRER